MGAFLVIEMCYKAVRERNEVISAVILRLESEFDIFNTKLIIFDRKNNIILWKLLAACGCFANEFTFKVKNGK